MEWKDPFVIYRITADAKIEEVFHAKDLKHAKYWLQYIAQPGDVLCRTPVHPKHTKQSNRPEYWSHKESSGTPSSKEDDWKRYAADKSFNLIFPEEQLLTLNSAVNTSQSSAQSASGETAAADASPENKS
jgi:hypothetical protein